MKKFNLYIANKEDPTKWTTLIVVEAANRTAALNKVCQLMADEPFLRDLIKYAYDMEVKEIW